MMVHAYHTIPKQIAQNKGYGPELVLIENSLMEGSALGYGI